jgi:rhomboid family GlyGly-CTERM serine protease
MGLIQGDTNHRQSRAFRVWLLPVVALVVAVLLEFTGEWGREWFRYDRALIHDGEVWRLLSGHFVHLGWSHLVLNGMGLLLVSYLVASRYATRQWLLITVFVVAGIDLGFWVLQPQLEWYVGLSGLLHGLLAAGLVSGVLQRQPEYLLVAAGLAAKLLYEQLAGPLPGSEGTAGGSVVVAAHFYGAIAGALAGAFFCLRKASPAPI